MTRTELFAKLEALQTELATLETAVDNVLTTEDGGALCEVSCAISAALEQIDDALKNKKRIETTYREDLTRGRRK
jgi:hypothetical protein